MSPNKCQRCFKKSNLLIMSWFNVQMICSVCRDKELKHPKIKDAKKKEMEHCKRGNYNFIGIGLPKDL